MNYSTLPLNIGSRVIRDAARAYNIKTNAATMAQDVGISANELDGFIAGRTLLKAETLKASARRFWTNAEFVPELDRLKNTNKVEPKPIGRPPSVAEVRAADTMPQPSYSRDPLARAHRPVKPAPPAKAKEPRPGWIE